jgi:hypothetical protein
MAASEHLNPILFHGTASMSSGGVILPRASVNGTGAFATPSLSTARRIAREKARKEGKLFGVVYQVELMSKDTKPTPYSGTVQYSDPQGLITGNIVESPLNPNAATS